jgi:hypothetical protein
VLAKQLREGGHERVEHHRRRDAGRHDQPAAVAEIVVAQVNPL